MNTSIKQLASLDTIEASMLPALRGLGIVNIGDLLAYRPFRAARLVRAYAAGEVQQTDVAPYLTELAQGMTAERLLEGSAGAILGVSRSEQDHLTALGLSSVGAMARFAPFEEAEALVDGALEEESDPSGPACVIPRCKKYTRNRKSFVSFFRDQEVRNARVTIQGATSGIANLFQFGADDCGRVRLGYSVGYQQEWMYCGIHLGEPQGSVSLFMGQDTQVSVFDWKRMQSAMRKENTGASEELRQTLVHQRAVDEVARATAEEHQFGATSSAGANAATAGSFVAAGAVVGGIGGGISGALTGLVLGNAANVAGGAPTLAGAVAGTAVGSVAGAAAGSLVFSGATTLGFVQSDAQGDRSIVGRSAQNIQQRTVQNSSSLRSYWSNVISQSVQEEQQAIRTDRVTNHNRIHALNAIYFEVLNEYQVHIEATEAQAILFLPFRPMQFDVQRLKEYWWIIRTVLKDESLVFAVDDYFLTAQLVESSSDALADLPRIDEVMASGLTAKVNLDGSMIESFLFTALASIPNAATAIPAIALAIYEAVKRENVAVELLTDDGPKAMLRDPMSTLDTNYIGTYRLPGLVPIASIRGLRIRNNNAEFQIPTPFWDAEKGEFIVLDINKLDFEAVLVSFDIKNKSDYSTAVPSIGELEDEWPIGGTFTIRSNRSKDLTWSVGDSLRSKFSGIQSQIDSLEAAQDDQESIEARISNLLGFLNANKYGFTRLILQMVEREQLMCALERVQISNVDLSDLAEPNPIGFCGTHVALPLKQGATIQPPAVGIGVDTSKLLGELRNLENALIQRSQVQQAATSMVGFLAQFLPLLENNGNGSQQEKSLALTLQGLQSLVARLSQDHSQGSSSASTSPGSILRGRLQAIDLTSFWSMQALALVQEALDLIQTQSTPSILGTIEQIQTYAASLRSDLEALLGTTLWSDELSLPSPAVFMEPVLSHAKGAELYDMRRNSHYSILPSPGISAADPNTNRYQDVSLTPTELASVLDQISEPNYALPSSLQTALGEAGKLNLSDLIQSNAKTLTSTLGELSGLAEALAKASADLTGDAQEQAMKAASGLAQQLSKTIESSLPDLAQLARMGAPTPDTPQKRSEVAREARRIDSGSGTKQQKKERKAAVGVPQEPETTQDYQLSLELLDSDGDPYGAGSLLLQMDQFQTGETHAFNGGQPIDFSESRYFAEDRMTLESGRRVTVRFSPVLGGVENPGQKTFVLPNHPDLHLRARMKSKSVEVMASDAKTAVDTVVSNHSFELNLAAMLSKYLDAGVKFPFEIAEIDLGGGGKQQLDFGAAYTSGGSSSGSTTVVASTQRKFEVRIPIKGWNIEVNP